jgi:dTMP kinase
LDTQDPGEKVNSAASSRGRFITFEGGEGAGKSVQARELAQRLKSLGMSVVSTREPGGSPNAEALRRVILSGAAAQYGASGEALLFSAARIDHIDVTIEPALTRGDWVVCDRFADSTRAYQGAAGQLDPVFITNLENVVLDQTRPDLTLILDLPAERGLERAAKRRSGQGAPDRFEGEGLAFHETLRNAFLRIAREEPERCAVIDATLSEDEVAEAIWAVVSQRLADFLPSEAKAK